MMMSMVDMPEPTRAEVSDVATAVFLGADAVMLSDETANGKYPVETVKSMKRIVTYAEHNSPMKKLYEVEHDHDTKTAVASAVLTLAENIRAKAIVAETKSGNTAVHIASQRPEAPVLVVTSEIRVAQQMALVYAVKSYVRPVDAEAAGKLTDWLRDNKLFEKGDMVVTVSGRYPGVTGATDTIKVRAIE
jgi:pyruvate kinase